MAEEQALVMGQTQLTRADFQQAWAAVPAFRGLRLYAMALPGLCAVLLLLSFASSKHDGRAFALGPHLLVLIMPALAVWFLLTAPRNWAKRAMMDWGSGPVVFRFDAEGLSVESALRQHHLAWGALPQHIETPSSFLVYTGTQALLVVPKRAFAERDLAVLRELLRTRIPTLRPKSRLPKLFAIWVIVLVVFLTVWQLLSSSPH